MRPSVRLNNERHSACRKYMENQGVSRETIAKIAEKDHRHSVSSYYSQFRDHYSVDEILASPTVQDPLTKLQCCPTSDGPAAAVLANKSFVERQRLWDQAVEITGQVLSTDDDSTFDGGDAYLVGYQMTMNTARAVCEESGLGLSDLHVIELAFPPTKRWPVRDRRRKRTHRGRRRRIRLQDLAQCAEHTWQLRGRAELRQVDAAAVITVYRKVSR